ncbi:histidinol-phosphatase HisJ family protein [Romboutsia maritimum]|uniref:Histidinol-phosphatase n=1 Tax=Romboutsia maritimum TaxID=2020948 RepID=A0A371ISB7_9FIRM|nr:histidinol-phosphatase HisJ family protein [Romboutsia maritimum]RDY23378.1 histidinol-phosphatase HisJ family protein [Romboutsia maritimum]
MFYDYHMHSNFSGDSKTTMEDMVKKSIDLGLKEICFTDHVDYDIKDSIYEKINYDKYFQNIEFLKNKYNNKISIKKGIELGLQRHIVDTCKKDVDDYPFDFVICSIHTIDKLELYFNKFFEGKTQLESYQRYYEELYTVVKTFKDYCVLGHLDLIKRYGDFDKLLDDSLFYDIIESILKQVISDGKGIEINTSCFRYNLPDLTPSKYILEMYKNLGGEIITTGSDSHNPSQIAYQFDYIYPLLKNLGFKYISTFNKMNPEFIKL